MRVELWQLHQMAVSTNPSLGGHVIQLVPPLSDTENYWKFQGYSPFQWQHHFWWPKISQVSALLQCALISH